MELKFVAAKKPGIVNATVQRRQRLVRRLDQQIKLIEGASEYIIPRASWVWQDHAGTYFINIKYGRTSIELNKGMFAIECNHWDEVAAALCEIRERVVKGEMDGQIAQASGQIRAAFKSKKFQVTDFKRKNS